MDNDQIYNVGMKSGKEFKKIQFWNDNIINGLKFIQEDLLDNEDEKYADIRDPLTGKIVLIDIGSIEYVELVGWENDLKKNNNQVIIKDVVSSEENEKINIQDIMKEKKK